MKTKQKLKIEYVKIDSLNPYANNAKIHTEEQVEQIARSIETFGFNDPIAVWGEDNEIIEGHGRLMAAKELGMDEVPIIHLDELSDEERRAYMLAHNQLTMNTGFDMELLDAEIELLDIDMTQFGFEAKEIVDPNEIIEDEVPEDAPTRAKPGDIWRLGQHRLICGDSTDEEVVGRLMDGALADMLLTDPPYNVDYEGTAGKILNDNMENQAFRQFLVDAFAAANENMRKGAVFYIWHADTEGYNFRGACFDVGWKVRECLIWNKNSMVMGRQDYHWKHEPCLYGWKDGDSHLWASDRKQTTVLNYDKPIKNDLHPTMKPVGLIAYQVGNNTHQGDAILDPFGGSGTTLIACEQLNRKCYMAELDPKYCDVILQRWENLTGQTAELEERNV